jgi:hypothetical protein
MEIPIEAVSVRVLNRHQPKGQERKVFEGKKGKYTQNTSTNMLLKGKRGEGGEKKQRENGETVGKICVRGRKNKGGGGAFGFVRITAAENPSK